MNIKYYLRLKFNKPQNEFCRAISNDDYKYVEYILKHAYINSNSNINSSYINYFYDIEIYNLLNRYNMIKEKHIFQLIRNRRSDREWIEKYIQDYKNDINLDKALALAAFHDNIFIAKILIETGADINRKIPSSPLYNAVYNGYLDMVKLLIENGATVDIMTKNTSKYTNSLNEVSYKTQQKMKEIIEEEFKVQSLFTYTFRYVKKNKIVIAEVPDEIKAYL